MIGAVVACAVLLSGCKVGTTVTVKSDEDGRGRVSVRVSLDAEAVFALQAGGGTLESAVAIEDLSDAGWKVAAWAREESGAASISMSKAFVGEEQLAEILDELTGEDGMLRDPRIDRSRGIVRSSDALSVTADLSGLESGLAGDAEVVRRLEGAGVDAEALDATLTDGLESAFSMTVRLAMADEQQRWRITPGDEQSLVVSKSRIEWDRLTTLGIASILSLLAALLFLAALVSSRRRKKARRAPARGIPTW